MMANRIFSIKFIKPINYLILLLLISFSFLLNTDEFYIIDYIIDGDVYNLSDLQGEINDNPMIIKLFFIINNISILFFLLGRKFIGIFCFILTAYFFVHLIGDLDLLFHIIYSSIKLKNIWLILILVLYFLLCLINLFPLFINMLSFNYECKVRQKQNIQQKIQTINLGIYLLISLYQVD